MTDPTPESVDVLVVGGGPAGLAAAIELRRRGVARVVIVDREAQLGGIPRHSMHTGFGLRDLHRVLSGPAYAARYVELASRAGVDLRAETTVTGWVDATSLSITSPSGLAQIAARAVILATGCRERPRPARLVPGDRPLGVYTTGSLQQLVYLQRQAVGRRALVVGAEHVSFSAVLTLAHAGTRTVAMVTEHPRHQTYLPYKWLSTTRLGVPLLTSTQVARVAGKRRVEAVELANLETGRRRTVDCDTVVFTGDWIADHELARRGEIEIDRGTRGPYVDTCLRTSRRGVFAAGNLLHGAETADVAALSGRHVAASVADFLSSGNWPQRSAVRIQCEQPLLWVSPNAIFSRREQPPHDAMLLRTGAFLNDVEICVSQAKRQLWRQHYRSLTPNLPVRLSSAWVPLVDAGSEAIRIYVRP
jgi:thioredoxin reductase